MCLPKRYYLYVDTSSTRNRRLARIQIVTVLTTWFVRYGYLALTHSYLIASVN